MTEQTHLQECPLRTGVYDDRAECLCDVICAVEKRVRAEIGTGVVAGEDFAGAEWGLTHAPSCKWYGRDTEYMTWSEENYCAGWLICPCEKELEKP